jgi:hypothetical protein
VPGLWLRSGGCLGQDLLEARTGQGRRVCDAQPIVFVRFR